MIFKNIAPSLVSFLRIPLGFLVYYSAINNHWVTAFLLLLLALLTDGIDGWLALKLKVCSPAGAVVDAVCDLSMTIGMIAGLVFTHTIPWIIVWALIVLGLTINITILVRNKKSRFFWLCEGINPFAGVVVASTCVLLYLMKTNEPILWTCGGIAAIIVLIYLPAMKSHRIKDWWRKLQKAFQKDGP